MKIGQLAIAAAAAVAVSSCADYPPPGPPPEPLPIGVAMAPGECFRTADIRAHTVGDDRTLFVNVQGKGVYRVAMRGACLAGAISSDPLVMEQPPGSALVCRPMDMDVRISKGGAPALPCIVDAITRLNPTEVAALPPRLRP
jgi:hypothetical protein